MSFKTLLFVIGVVGLVGNSYALDGDYTKVEENNYEIHLVGTFQKSVQLEE